VRELRNGQSSIANKVVRDQTGEEAHAVERSSAGGLFLFVRSGAVNHV